MKYLSALVLGTTLLATATATTAQEMPPRQIGSLDVNSLTPAPLWTIRSAEIDADPTEIFDYISSSENLAESRITVDEPSIFAWQLTNNNALEVSDHLGVIHVMPDQEDGQGSIVSISAFFNHPDIDATLPIFEDSGERVATTLINRFGGSLANDVSGYQTVTISTTRTVNASKADVWQVLAEDFAEVGEWSSLISDVDFIANDQGGMLGATRFCFIPAFGESVEERITTYDESSGTLAYDIVKGLPPFVTQGENTFDVVAIDANTTQVSSTMTMQIAPQTPGLPIGMAKQNFAHAVSLSLDELTYFIENNAPHPREIASREAE